MRKIVFDIETSNTFHDVNSTDPAKLDLSVVVIYDSETDKYSHFLKETLPNLWPILEKADMLIGYNSEHFDVPLLNKYYSGDLTQIKSLDILKEIKNSYGRRMKLNQVAEGTLGVQKSGHGLQAIGWWKAGEIDKIVKYCTDDVKITKDLYDYAIKNGCLKFKEGGAIMDIKLDTTNWESGAKNTLTYTLPF